MTVSDSWCNSTFKCFKVLLEVALRLEDSYLAIGTTDRRKDLKTLVWGTCDLRKDMIFPLRLTTKEGSQISMTN